MEIKSFNKFIILWIGQLVSGIGSGLTAFGLGVYVFQETGSATAMSIVTLLAFLPSLLLTPLAGVFADKYDRRILMVVGDGCSALGLIFILVCIWDGKASLAQICLGYFISAVFASLMEPAYKATISDLLTEEEYSRASGLVQAAGSAKYLISPILAGLILGAFDMRLILILDISTFFLTAGVTMMIQRSLPKKETVNTIGFWAGFRDGVRTIQKQKGVMQLLVLTSALTFFIGIVQTLSTPLVLSFSDSMALGVLETVVALGMLASSVFLGFYTLKKNYINVLWLSLLVAGIAMMLFGMRENLIFMGLFGILFFAALPFANTCLDCLIRTCVPNEKQGRIWGVAGVMSQIGYVIAYGICGIAADKIFEPLMGENGKLAAFLGGLYGVGPGRGIGLMISLAGISVCIIAFFVGKIKLSTGQEESL